MAKKEPNPNTKYGRRRLHKEHQEWRENLTPEQRKETDSFGLWGVIIVIVIILVIVFAVGGKDGVFKWLTR